MACVLLSTFNMKELGAVLLLAGLLQLRACSGWHFRRVQAQRTLIDSASPLKPIQQHCLRRSLQQQTAVCGISSLGYGCYLQVRRKVQG